MARALFVLLSCAACSTELAPVPCSSDANCPAGMICGSSGKCEEPAACAAGQSVCGAACANLASDPAHCGTCDHACAVPQGGTASCAAGACDFSCTAPLLKNGALCAPAAPGGLSAQGALHHVSLAWNAVAGATSYVVRRADNSGGPYAEVGTPAGTSFVDAVSANGFRYYYVVRAASAGGSGPDSVEASARTLSPVLTVTVSGVGTVTSAPAGISCSAGVCQAAFPTGPVTLSASAAVSWSAPCAGQATCTLPLDQDTSITASF